MGQWTADGPQATLENLHLQISGFGMPSTEVQLAAQWTPSRLNLTRLHVRQPQSAARPGACHTARAAGTVSSRYSTPASGQPALVSPAYAPPCDAGHPHGAATYRRPRSKRSCNTPGAQIHADLSVQLQEPLPRYRAHCIDGLALTQVPHAQGVLRPGSNLQGRMGWGTAPGTLDATVETTGFNLAPGLTARLRATLVGTALQLEQLQMRSTVATLTASGTLSTSSKATLQYRLTLGNLASLQPLLGVPVQASGDLSGEYGARSTLCAYVVRSTGRLACGRF